MSGTWVRVRREGVKILEGSVRELTAGMTVQFVVLHHTGIEEPHFDFMLEVAGREELLTWRLKAWPMDVNEGHEVGALRIADHRRRYLTYEGVISGGRGAVARVAEGTARVEQISDEQVVIELRADPATKIHLPLA